MTEVEDVALGGPAGGQGRLDPFAHHRPRGEQDRGVEVALQGVGRADPPGGLVQRDAEVDADDVRPAPAMAASSSPDPTPKWMRGTPSDASGSRTAAEAGRTLRT